MQYSKNSNKFLNTASAVSYYINYVLGTSVYDPTKYYAPSEYSGGILMDSIFSPSEKQVLDIVSKAISEHEKSKEALVNRLSSSLITETFVQELIRRIKESGKKDSDIYRAARIDRRLFSKIISNENYHPSRDTAIALALALRLDFVQTLDMIGKAGYTISRGCVRDLFIEYFICSKTYDLDLINAVLFEFDQAVIGKYNGERDSDEE